MTVVQINGETLLQFVERVGTVCAENVEMRFSWDNRTARTELRKLVQAGLLVESGRFARFDGVGGTRLEWRLAGGLTPARLVVLRSARHFPPSAWVVDSFGGRTGWERVSWKKNCAWLVAHGFLRANAHGDFYLTDAGEAAAGVGS